MQSYRGAKTKNGIAVPLYLVDYFFDHFINVNLLYREEQYL